MKKQQKKCLFWSLSRPCLAFLEFGLFERAWLAEIVLKFAVGKMNTVMKNEILTHQISQINANDAMMALFFFKKTSIRQN